MGVQPKDQTPGPHLYSSSHRAGFSNLRTVSGKTIVSTSSVSSRIDTSLSTSPSDVGRPLGPKIASDSDSDCQLEQAHSMATL